MLTNLASKCVYGICQQPLKTTGGDDYSSRKNSRKKTLMEGAGMQSGSLFYSNYSIKTAQIEDRNRPNAENSG